MKGVQCYELFGGIALRFTHVHLFFFTNHINAVDVMLYKKEAVKWAGLVLLVDQKMPRITWRKIHTDT